MAVCGVTVDVFQNNDGVIHDHADAHGNAAQTHHVHGQITHVHQNEGGQRTHGHGDGNGQGCAPAAQEQEHHDTGQQNAHQNVADGGIHRQIDKVGGQIGNAVADVAVFGGQLFHLGSHSHSCSVLVGTGLLGDLQNDAVFTVHLCHGVGLHVFQIDVSHFVQTNGAAGGQSDHHIGNISHTLELGVGTDG